MKVLGFFHMKRNNEHVAEVGGANTSLSLMIRVALAGMKDAHFLVSLKQKNHTPFFFLLYFAPDSQLSNF